VADPSIAVAPVHPVLKQIRDTADRLKGHATIADRAGNEPALLAILHALLRLEKVELPALIGQRAYRDMRAGRP